MPRALARHQSPSSSVVRASDRCMGGHGFDSHQGLRFFSLSQARDILNSPSFLFRLVIKEIKAMRPVYIRRFAYRVIKYE